MSPYEKIPSVPPDPIFGLDVMYRADPRPDKLTLVTGYFRRKDLQTPVLDTVAEVEDRIAEQRLKREYLPIDGDAEYVREMGKLVFGRQWSDEICGFQTVGGTGALFLAGNIASKWTDRIAISNHTWANHWNIFATAGLKTEKYPYYENKELLFEQMIESLQEGTCFLVHTNAHNPTGFDLSEEQWKELAQVVKKRKLFPIMDMAYQGFSRGVDEDAFGPRLFLREGIEFALTYTCAKNFSIYSERAGALFFIGENLENVNSMVKATIRGYYSNPPKHAAEIVKRILGDEKLKERWIEELAEMRKRIRQAREDFVRIMQQKDPGGHWGKLLFGTGLFSMTDLGKDAIERLREEKGIYLTSGGRINLTGLNSGNIERVADALLNVR